MKEYQVEYEDGLGRLMMWEEKKRSIDFLLVKSVDLYLLERPLRAM